MEPTFLALLAILTQRTAVGNAGQGLTITPTALPEGVAGTAYPAAQLTAAGGTGALTWSSVSPLPAGLSLSSAGQVTGTPTAAGPGGFTVQVTDSAVPPNVASAQVSLSVLGITTGTLPGGAVGAAYPATQLVSTGGTGVLSWTSTGTLPAGLALSRAGVINGTPTALGQSSFTAEVTDSATPAQTASVTLTIDVAQLAVNAITPPEGAVGVVYPATQLTATGGTGALTWISSGTLPAGLNVSTTGVLAGTPTIAGQTTFTVTVTDSATPAKTASLDLSVSILGIITTATLPEGAVGAVYPATQLVSTGGTGTLTWDASSGTLPSGLDLSRSGMISGTPTVAGPASFTVTVTDGATPPQQATGQFTLSVLGITTSSLPEGAVGTDYPPTQLNAAGGTGTLTWSGGALPAGLSLSGTGVITGTPSAGGTDAFTVTVTDGATPPQQASATLTIDVAAEPVEVPQVHGRPEAAREKLLSLGLVVADQVLEAISDKPSGTVVGTYPPAGSLVPPAASIQLVVSNAVEVPSVTGFPLEEAEEMLSQAGFGVSTSTEGNGGGQLVVRHQSPEGGSWVPRRSTVSLVLGVPDYPESGQARATARMTSATAGGTAAGRRRSTRAAARSED